MRLLCWHRAAVKRCLLSRIPPTVARKSACEICRSQRHRERCLIPGDDCRNAEQRSNWSGIKRTWTSQGPLSVARFQIGGPEHTVTLACTRRQVQLVTLRRPGRERAPRIPSLFSAPSQELRLRAQRCHLCIVASKRGSALPAGPAVSARPGPADQQPRGAPVRERDRA